MAGQRLFEPGSTGELLRGWLIHAHKGRDRHDSAARIYERSKYAVGIPALVVSTIVSTSVFSAVASQAESPVSLWVGMLSVGAAVLAALQIFLDYPARAERHRAAGVKYKAIIRSVEHLLASLATALPVTDDQITQIQQKLDELEDSAPVIMPRIYSRVEQRYQGVEYVQEAVGLYRRGAKGERSS